MVVRDERGDGENRGWKNGGLKLAQDVFRLAARRQDSETQSRKTGRERKIDRRKGQPAPQLPNAGTVTRHRDVSRRTRRSIRGGNRP
jgi:hypothetical protein